MFVRGRSAVACSPSAPNASENPVGSEGLTSRHQALKTEETVRKASLHLRARFQLVPERRHNGCGGGSNEYLPRLGWRVAIALTVAACATTVRVPGIPILDSPAYKAAIRKSDRSLPSGSSRCRSHYRCRDS